MPRFQSESPRGVLLAAMLIALAAAPVRTVHAADCNNNGIDDLMDVDQTDPDGDGLVSGDCNDDGIPDECEIPGNDCNANGIPDDCEHGPTATELKTANPMPFDWNGYSVSLDGDTLIAGAPHRSSWAGISRIYRRTGNGWKREATLQASDAETGDEFGFSVSIDGDVAIIGAQSHDSAGTNSGAAYVFQRTSGIWSELAKLTAPDGADGDVFGSAVSICDPWIIIGAYQDVSDNVSSGSAYVFHRDGATWQFATKLIPTDAEPSQRFGRSVAIHGDTAIVGAPLDDEANNDNGSAYVFREMDGTWVFEQKLSVPDASPEAQFGTSVAIDGNFAVVGADQAETTLAYAGAAYVYRRENSQWDLEARLSAFAPGFFDFFGGSVDIHSDSLVVGARRIDTQVSTSGAAFLYQRSGSQWIQSAMISQPQPEDAASFGHAVSIAGSHVAIGAYASNMNNQVAGAVYAFNTDAANDCNNNNTPDDCDVNPLDPDGDALVFEDCNADGVPDVCQLANNDCNANNIPDDCDIDANDPDDDGIVSEDCDEDLLPDECEPDCNANGIADDCDYDPSDPDGDGIVIADCNENQVPDDCELVENDCNANEIPDDCEIAPTGVQQLIAQGAATGDVFAGAVSIDGEYALIGSSELSKGVQGREAAYIFRHVNGAWIEDTQLIDWDGRAEGFGASVALDGDTALVGAWGAETDGQFAGAAYVFRRIEETWQPEARLWPDDGEHDDAFGASVALDGDVALIGAFKKDYPGNQSGSAYIFRRSTGVWLQEAQLPTSPLATGDQFGHYIDLDRETAVVGVSRDDDDGTSSGSVYVYQYDNGTWEQQVKLRAFDAAEFDEFGRSVAVTDDTLLIGAPFDDDTFPSSGSVYVYERVGADWDFLEKLNANTPTTSDEFGRWLCVHNDVALVTSKHSRHAVDEGWVVNVFRRNASEWRYIQQIKAIEDSPTDSFGTTLAYDGKHALIGASRANTSVERSGAAFVFDPRAHDCNLNGLPDDCDIAGDLNGDGAVNIDDIPHLVSSLLRSASCTLADFNQDGAFNSLDIAGFIDSLFTADDCNHNGIADDNDALGDVNGDGEVDLADVPGFVRSLLNESDCTIADINQDGSVDGNDVGALSELLIGP